jgi:hypothetical protein
MCLEMVQFIGGRAVLFSNHVRQLPGMWDVFAADPKNRWPEFAPDHAIDRMIELTGTPYGWRNIFLASLRHLAVLRFFQRAPTDDRPDGTPPFCSAAVSEAAQYGGVDPVPHLSNAATEPGDLARAEFFQYKFTLDWDTPHNADSNEATEHSAAAA